MRKKIAVCGNGWNNEFLKVALDGIKRSAKENNVDLFVFMNYSHDEGVEYNDIGETNIYRLLDYAQMDGIILLGNTLHLLEEFQYLTDKVKDTGIPAISLEYQMQGIDFLGSDNYSGMYDICMHLLAVHEVENVVYIGGPEHNEENRIRRKAVEDALSSRGYTLMDSFCGNWNYVETQRLLPAWLDAHEQVPDAFVCANDVMAMAVCAVLNDRDLKVPEDVIVTGFDHLKSAREHRPSITTVDRNWNDMGYQALYHLLWKINNKPVKEATYIKSCGIPARSCGCDFNYVKDVLGQRVSEQGGTYDSMMNVVYWGGHLCDISESMTMVTSEEELHQKFNDFLEREHMHEGEEVYICLLDDFFSTLKEGVPLRKRGYTETVDVICGLHEGKGVKRIPKMDITQLVPGYDGESEEPGFYLFLPLYDREGHYGYVIFGTEIQMMYDYSLYNWLRNIKQSLGNVRQNIRLVELNKRLEKQSVTDGLTGVYNRMGCERIAYPYLEKCHKQGKEAVLMFADINKMKTINDKYGHLQGDLAICTVAKSIQNVLSEDWIVVRYGGDEFLMVGECGADKTATQLLDEIQTELENTTKEMMLPYPLKAGVGYVVISPEEKLDMSDCLKRADEAMYLMKKKQKENEEIR